jgi:hypothetical protein
MIFFRHAYQICKLSPDDWVGGVSDLGRARRIGDGYTECERRDYRAEIGIRARST